VLRVVEEAGCPDLLRLVMKESEGLDIEVGGEDEAKQRAHLDPDARRRRVAPPASIGQCALSFCTHQSTHALV
jgi:hypothetical protein